MGTVIKVENLSKQYRLGEVGAGTLKDDFKRFSYRLMGKEDPFLQVGEVNDRTQKSSSDYVWALKNINFEIEQGDVVGIIGRNGAGKSTLLKILSRTTAPTTGSVKVKGRIASLLEVGTGFHGELSGRENIYLNGAIMGLRKWEIDKKLDEIIDFAGVDKYIDTPVKRYSSGMYIRLAFAVAAYLEPDILVVDEVLAVGDSEFQKKCIGKMKDVSTKGGRTVIVVSHNMGVIQSLCNKGILLLNGTLNFNGSKDDAVLKYLNDGRKSEFYVAPENKINKFIMFKKIFLGKDFIQNQSCFFHDEEVKVNFEIEFSGIDRKNDFKIFCIILDKYKKPIFSVESELLVSSKLSFLIPSNLLVRGVYSLTTFIHKPQIEQVDHLEDVCKFEILDNGSKFNIHGDYDYGNVFVTEKWLNS